MRPLPRAPLATRSCHGILCQNPIATQPHRPLLSHNLRAYLAARDIGLGSPDSCFPLGRARFRGLRGDNGSVKLKGPCLKKIKGA